MPDAGGDEVPLQIDVRRRRLGVVGGAVEDAADGDAARRWRPCDHGTRLESQAVVGQAVEQGLMPDRPVAVEAVRPVENGDIAALLVGRAFAVVGAAIGVEQAAVQQRQDAVVLAEVDVAVFQIETRLCIRAEFPGQDWCDESAPVVDEIDERAAILVRGVHPVEQAVVCGDRAGGIHAGAIGIEGPELLNNRIVGLVQRLLGHNIDDATRLHLSV